MVHEVPKWLSCESWPVPKKVVMVPNDHVLSGVILVPKSRPADFGSLLGNSPINGLAAYEYDQVRIGRVWRVEEIVGQPYYWRIERFFGYDGENGVLYTTPEWKREKVFRWG